MTGESKLLQSDKTTICSQQMEGKSILIQFEINNNISIPNKNTETEKGGV